MIDLDDLLVGGSGAEWIMVTAGHNRRIAILPAPIIDRALRDPLTRRLLVTNAGSGGGHYLEHPLGAEYAIVHVCVSGVGWIRIDGQTHPVGPGTAFLVAAGVPNVYGSGSPAWSSRWCTLVGSEVADFAEAMGASRAKPVVPIADLDRAVALIDEIVEIYDGNIARTQLLQATATAWRLMTLLAVDRFLPAREDPLARAMDYLAERLDADIEVTELATLVGLSTSHLGALFRAATGGGILAYRSGLRMAKARRLLDSTSGSIAEIGRSVGFRDPYYFSRYFRREHGMSPREFRQRQRF